MAHGLEDELLSWKSVEKYFEKLSITKPNVEINTISNLTHQMNLETFFIFKKFFEKAAGT